MPERERERARQRKRKGEGEAGMRWKGIQQGAYCQTFTTPSLWKQCNGRAGPMPGRQEEHTQRKLYMHRLGSACVQSTCSLRDEVGIPPVNQILKHTAWGCIRIIKIFRIIVMAQVNVVLHSCNRTLHWPGTQKKKKTSLTKSVNSQTAPPLDSIFRFHFPY